MRSDITPGGTFPDYALPDHTSTVRTLSELQGRDPLLECASGLNVLLFEFLQLLLQLPGRLRAGNRNRT